MKIYIFFILFSFLHISTSKNEEKTRELKYTIKKIPFSNEITHSHSLKHLKKYKNKPAKSYLDKNTILEIEENCIIKSISLKTIDYNKIDYLLGIFEGSNDIKFSDSTPIGIIKDKLHSKRKNYIEINSKTSYKYIRYIPPNKHNSGIKEIKLYGYKKSSKNILQNLNEDNYYQVTNLPLIIINTEEEKEPLLDEDINCHIKIINSGKLEINEDAKIKVRGHSTSMVSTKKPFRIKFATKKKMFNFKGKEKKWTLLANYYDRSVLRNTLAFKISELMQFEFTPRCQSVDVIMNSNFRGNYYLCDKIEIGENRVNITEMGPDDITEPNISGGYLLKIDGWATFSGTNIFQTDKGLVGEIEYPEEDEINSEQRAYIISQLNKFESEIYNDTLDSIDLNSYSKFFLIKEFCGDPDHVWSSFYFTKDRNDNLFRFGPAWDFDLGFDNDDRLIPTNDKT